MTMERVIDEQGIKGIMLSNDEIDKIIIRKDRRIDLYMRGRGCFSFYTTGEMETYKNAFCELAPAEENPNWEESPN